MLSKYRDEFKPTHAVSAMDMPGETFRHRKFDEYKLGKVPCPTILPGKFLSRGTCSIFGVPTGRNDSYEAGNLIGTLSLIGEERGMSVIILTGDRDTLQLISDNTSVVLCTKRTVQSEVIT